MEVVKSQNSRILKYILVIFLGSILLTISSKIKIPFYPVPMTMQTFVVLFMGMAFGWKIGVATISLYLFEGILGFPVFAGTPEKGIGISYMLATHRGAILTPQVAGNFIGCAAECLLFLRNSLHIGHS